MAKRQKAELTRRHQQQLPSSTQPTDLKKLLEGIDTPFKSLTNFEANVLHIVDEFLVDSEKLQNTHSHWFLKHGLSDDYKKAKKSAVQHADVKTLKLIDSVDLNMEPDLFTQAIRLGHMNVVEYFLSRCVNAKSRQDFIKSSRGVHTASIYGRPTLIKYLISQIADVNLRKELIKAHNNQTINVAIKCFDLDVIKFLVGQFVDEEERRTMINANENGLTCQACWSGQLDMIRYFQSEGATLSPSEQDKCYFEAWITGNSSVVEYFQSHYPDSCTM